ncbi:hypothetical protein ACS0TY_022176 [Phlomoides rotata]
MSKSLEYATHRIPLFSVESYDLWKIRIEAHLASLHDRMWEVITDGPIQFGDLRGSETTAEQSVNAANAQDNAADQTINGQRVEAANNRPNMIVDAEQSKLMNLDRVARSVLLQAVPDACLNKLKNCKTAKQIWDALADMCEGSEEIKENKLIMVVQKFDYLKMSSNETIDQFDNKYTAIINEINDLGKEYTNKEIALKILRALPKKWRTKRTIIKDTKNLSKLTPSQLFSMLKAYEFDLNYDDDAEPTTPTTSKSVAFKASKSESSKRSECRSEG